MFSFSILSCFNVMGMSAYFAALTPFVGSYIIVETIKKEPEAEEETDEN